jgi:hypothetical protein
MQMTDIEYAFPFDGPFTESITMVGMPKTRIKYPCKICGFNEHTLIGVYSGEDQDGVHICKACHKLIFGK